MISLLKSGKLYVNPNRKEYLIDSEKDIASLPTPLGEGDGIIGICAPGSIAYTPDLTLICILGNDNVWHKAVGV